MIGREIVSRVWLDAETGMIKDDAENVFDRQNSAPRELEKNLVSERD